MMKILMLDNDGVICLSNNWGGRAKKWANFHKDNPDVDFTNRPIDCRFDDFDENIGQNAEKLNVPQLQLQQSSDEKEVTEESREVVLK